MKRTAIPMGLLCGSLCAAQFNVPVEKFRLDNGMKVVMSVDNTVPVVAVYMIYNVGARSEEKGRTGFAHLFEHMMFEGSQNAPKGVHGKQVQMNGGVLNGSTHPDFTDYFEVLPSNKLGVALWLESDRMRSLALTAENLTNQKEAVKQERRLTFDNQPYNTAIVDVWPTMVFSNWQSSHSLIGSFEDLNAATIEDVTRFFKTYYAPNNATLVLVGDFKAAEARKLVQTYFGDIASQPQSKRPDLSEPVERLKGTQTHRDALANVPGVVIGYPAPPRRSADYYALGLIDALLTGGETARLKQDLVKGKKSIIQYQGDVGWPFSGVADYKDPGDYAVFMLYKPNFTGTQIVEQFQEEIQKIQSGGVDAAELDRAKTLLRSDRIKQMQSTLARARALGTYETFDGDASLINSELDRFLAVTLEQVQDAAKRYLASDKRTVLEIVPAPKPPATSEKKGDH
jgi:zinc protease